jgi:hypothetical protein
MASEGGAEATCCRVAVLIGYSLAYGAHKTFSNRCKRWGERGVFLRMMDGLAAASATPKTFMIDATYPKAHRTASSLRVKKGGLGRLIGHTKGGMNTTLHAVTDA